MREEYAHTAGLSGRGDSLRSGKWHARPTPTCSPPHCFTSSCHAVASTRSHDAPCTPYPNAGRSDYEFFVSTATSTTGDDSARDGACDSRPNATLAMYLAPRFAL